VKSMRSVQLALQKRRTGVKSARFVQGALRRRRIEI